MRLNTKLALSILLSSLVIVLVFILLLPSFVEQIADRYTDANLRQQKKQVLNEIDKNGIDYYLDGEPNYGSYTMLKEEYISLEQVTGSAKADSIQILPRIFAEGDTSDYRILSHYFIHDNKTYLLEVGKEINSISEIYKPLQRVAFSILTALILATVLFNLLYTRYLLKPLNTIIATRLRHRKFPYKNLAGPVKTSTADFRYLDSSIMQLMDQVHTDFIREREFTSNASHELMTPISILKTKIENMLADEDLSEAQYRKLSEMMRTLNRLKKIVQSLLLISRIENDQYHRQDVVKPAELIEEVMEELSHRLEEKKLTLKVNLSKDVALHRLNKDLIFQMFYNLINNAVRYNKAQGSIEIYDRRVPGKYAVIVRDSGIGIEPDNLPYIFNRFKKYSATAQESYGLGLAIVKSIAQYHDAEITVDSAPGAGTTFTILFNQHIHL